MKNCQRCGASVDLTQLFCSNCGFQTANQLQSFNPPPVVNQPQVYNAPPMVNNQPQGFNQSQMPYNQPQNFNPPQFPNHQAGYGNQPPNNYQNLGSSQPSSTGSVITPLRLILAILSIIIGLSAICSGLAAIGGSHR